MAWEAKKGIEMLDVQDFKNLVVVPTLQEIGLYSPEATNITIGTFLKESGLRNLKQIGGGPGLGLGQSEPNTTKDTWFRYLARKDKLDLRFKVSQFVSPSPDITKQVAGNMYLSVIFVRLKYFMQSEALPGEFDVEGMARYWSKYYQTDNVESQIQEFIKLYREHYIL